MLASIVPNAPEVTVVGEGVAVVFWEPPEITNGLIVNYELRFTGIGDKTTLLVDGEVLYYIPSSADIPHSNNGTVTAQVRYMQLTMHMLYDTCRRLWLHE